MISEPQQEQAALYALGLLDADEADAFERTLVADAELHALVRELRDSVASLAWLDHETGVQPSSDLKQRILRLASTENQPLSGPPFAVVSEPRAEEKIIRPRFGWLPWAAAALLLGCSAWLGTRLVQERQEFNARLADAGKTVPVDALAQVSFCELDPTPEFQNQPHAAVLWDSTQRRGVLRVNKLPPPAAGKDYELWTVEAGRQDAVSAGLVRVDADGRATVPFEPSEKNANAVVAVAISLEKFGGSPTTQGPILLLGKL